MQNPPTVQTGDRVLVVLEGTVPHVSDQGWFDVGRSNKLNSIYGDAEHVVSIEVLPKPLKVGDTIDGDDAYEALPDGAVVRGTSEVLLRTATGYADQFGRKYGPRSFNYPRTLVYLPE